MKYLQHSSSLMIDLVGRKLYFTRKQGVFMKHLQIYNIYQATNITVWSQYINTILVLLCSPLVIGTLYKYLLQPILSENILNPNQLFHFSQTSYILRGDYPSCSLSDSDVIMNNKWQVILLVMEDGPDCCIKDVQSPQNVSNL